MEESLAALSESRARDMDKILALDELLGEGAPRELRRRSASRLEGCRDAVARQAVGRWLGGIDGRRRCALAGPRGGGRGWRVDEDVEPRRHVGARELFVQ